MLRVTIEIVPHGREELAKVVAVGKIVNTGTGTWTRGNYRVDLGKCGKSTALWKRGFIEGFPRTQQNAWRLLKLALNEVIE